MKKQTLTTLILIFLCAGTYAQQTELELIRSAFNLEKKAAVAKFMNLPDADAGKFWPIYNKYEAERVTIGDRRVKLLENYANAYQKLDAVTAEKLWKESANIQKSEIGVREKYAAMIKKDVSGVVALKFYMAEDYISTAIKYKLYGEIPSAK